MAVGINGWRGVMKRRGSGGRLTSKRSCIAFTRQFTKRRAAGLSRVPHAHWAFCPVALRVSRSPIKRSGHKRKSGMDGNDCIWTDNLRWPKAFDPAGKGERLPRSSATNGPLHGQPWRLPR